MTSYLEDILAVAERGLKVAQPENYAWLQAVRDMRSITWWFGHTRTRMQLQQFPPFPSTGLFSYYSNSRVSDPFFAHALLRLLACWRIDSLLADWSVKYRTTKVRVAGYYFRPLWLVFGFAALIDLFPMLFWPIIHSLLFRFRNFNVAK